MTHRKIIKHYQRKRLRALELAAKAHQRGRTRLVQYLDRIASKHSRILQTIMGERV